MIDSCDNDDCGGGRLATSPTPPRLRVNQGQDGGLSK
ncbi:hypothetical protein SAMN05444166_3791 [Singulisphaera sp. GP187]|nr:hypothetical protein SAMN05444166_3791 [Singulisphaera sp. GP187]